MEQCSCAGCVRCGSHRLVVPDPHPMLLLLLGVGWRPLATPMVGLVGSCDGRARYGRAMQGALLVHSVQSVAGTAMSLLAINDDHDVDDDPPIAI